MSSPFPTSFSLFDTDTPLITLPTTSAATLLIPQHSHTSINTSLLIPPLSPSTSDSASSVGSTSPICSDSEDFAVPMDQLNNVKRLLRMFPPPMTAREFITRNSFKASDGHIKRPSNNFILFRKIAHDQKNQESALSNYNEREFSKIIGKIWDGLTNDEKTIYKTLGKQVAEIHKEMFPDYKYQPKRDRAAWKHFNPESNNSHQKSKRKNNKVKQQKHQETTEIPKINVNVPVPQEHLIPENLNYNLPASVGHVELDSISYYQEYPTNNTYTANDTYNFDDSNYYHPDWSGSNPMEFLTI